MHKQPHVLVLPNARGSDFDAGRFHDTNKAPRSKVIDSHNAKLTSISLSMKNEPATTRFPGPNGPPLHNWEPGKPNRNAANRSKPMHCFDGPMPLDTERSTFVEQRANCSDQGWPKEICSSLTNETLFWKDLYLPRLNKAPTA